MNMLDEYKINAQPAINAETEFNTVTSYSAAITDGHRYNNSRGGVAKIPRK